MAKVHFAFEVHLDSKVHLIKRLWPLISSASSLLVIPGHCSLMGLVRKIFDAWVVCDSSTGESGIASAGDSSPGLQGESGSGPVGDSSHGLWEKSGIWSTCW